jgi:extracellular elastinolytic metalloproteinase
VVALEGGATGERGEWREPLQFKVRGPLPVLAAALAIGGATPAYAATTEDVAREYVSSHAATFGVRAADVADLSMLSSYRTSGTGVTHVSLAQRHAGYDVLGSQVTVSVGRDGRIVFAAGNLIDGLRAGATPPTLDAAEAVEAAARELGLDDPDGLRVTQSKGQKAVLSGGGISASPIDAKLGWHSTAGQLRLAWQVVIDAASETHLWNATVDARTGSLLDSEDLTIHDDMGDLEGSLARKDISKNFAPPAFTLVTPSPVNDGSSYRVLGFPTESFNDADRTLINNPADSLSSPFGWHDTNGAAGPEFTTTQGNNVHAYMDQDDNELPDFNSSPSGGASLDFDFPIDLDEHAQSYRDAATANLFYTNNMIHDLAHHYGFDEASGNFQANNYGRGGTGGDYVRAEAADGNGTNNANFNPPVNDGGTPRMQMYLWPGNQLGAQNSVIIDGVGTYGASWARNTPPVTRAGIPSSTFVYAGNGCTAATYPATLPAGSWIAVVDGGTGTTACPYLARMQVAEAKGAKALVVAHNANGAAPTLSGAMTGASPTIPAVAVTQADGNTIKAALAAGPKTGTLTKNVAHPGIRDGDLENGIILHEYTHGISSRLTGGPGMSCLGGNEQAGEGWSDYMALTLLLDPALDDPEAARGMGPYALFQADRHGAGIRPRPYSRDMTIQPFTYDSIKTNGWLNNTSLALPHGLGHGWASVLWDLDWDLIDKYGFNRNLYANWNTAGNTRALQYVMDGLKLQGCQPGLVVARAAIIAGAQARNNGDLDTCTLWATFARRGLGYSAVQGTTNRNDNSEAFDTHPSCVRPFQGVAAGPAITHVVSGAAFPLTFSGESGYRALDVATKNNPYTRQVDCQTLKTVDPLQTTITPRPVPVPATTAGNAPLSVDGTGVYTYPWKTERAWGHTCREFVLTEKSGVQHRAFFYFIPSAETSAGGTVPATLSLTLGTPATFGAFAPGVARDYDATTTANVISTAGSAVLSIADASSTATGRLVNGAFSLPSALQARATSPAGIGAALANVGSSASPTTLLSYANPVSNDTVTLAFRQRIGASDALRTGAYSKTVTLTLSTTEP